MMNRMIQLRTMPTKSGPALIVDREAGVVYGLAVITRGTTLPSGNGTAPFEIDAVSLKQVADAINTSEIGVKSRLTHVELDGVSDDLPARLGYIRNARILGNSVIADMAFHDPDSSNARLLMDIAEQDPESCGLSIVSETANLEPVGMSLALRLDRLDAVDWVGQPAANPKGLIAASAAKESNMPSVRIMDVSPAQARQDAIDAMLIRCSCPLLAFDQHTGRPIRDRGGNLQYRQPSRAALSLSAESLVDIGAAYLRRVGPPAMGVALSRMSRPELSTLLMSRSRLSRYFPGLPMSNRITLAASNGDYPGLLADSLNKAVLSHYATARRSWRSWARQGTIRDFKEATRIRLEDAPALQQLLPGQSIEFGHLPENPAETITLATYARGLKFTRQAMLNDDAGALQSIGEVLAQGAYRLEDTIAYGILTANAALADSVALFATAHANITTGVLSTASLGSAIALLARRTNTNGDTLDLVPARLLVPTTITITAQQLLAGLQLADVFDGRIQLVSSAILDADSTAQWYLTTDPAVMAPVEVAFLEGEDGPRFDSATDFDTDGMKFKIVHDVAAKAIDCRAAVRSSGA